MCKESPTQKIVKFQTKDRSIMLFNKKWAIKLSIFIV